MTESELQERSRELWNESSRGCCTGLVEHLMETEFDFVYDSIVNGFTEDDEPKDFFEFYLVDGWLLEGLKELGEAVIPDLYGLKVWCRTCTGQACYMDGCIQTLTRKLFD